MKNFSFLFVFLFLLSEINCYAQENALAVDTIHIQTLADSCKKFADIGEFEKAMQYGNEALQLSRQYLPDAKGKTKRALSKAEEKALKNIGVTYYNLSDFPRAIEYYKQSEKVAEEIGDKIGIAAAQLNIGVVYAALQENNKALDYYQKSLKVFEEEKDERGIGICLNNIGDVYTNMTLYEKALDYFQRGLKIREETNDYYLSTSINNIGGVYEKLNNSNKAFEYYQRGLEVSKQMENPEEFIASSGGLGRILFKEGKTKEAEKYFLQQMKAATDNNALNYQEQASQQLRNVYEKQDRYKDALAMNDRATLLHDSITNQQKREEVAKQELKSEFAQKEAQTKAEHDKQIAIEEEKNQKQRVIIFSVVVGLILVVIFSIFILNRWRVTQKQKKIIEVQKVEVEKQRELADSRRIIAEEQKIIIEKSKKEIEDKNKDITDSITYAKRIQRAMLPHRSDIWAAFPQSFVLFKPKDIVSGDFYFFHKNEQSSFIAAVDCTGHGVPGAFMSMIGADKLNDAVSESSDTSEILSLLNKGIKTALKQSDSDESTRDGMDIAFCSVDNENRIVKYAGANRPIYIIRKGQTTVEEIKATKKAIGGLTEDSQHFDTHEIKLQQGDTFYISTDGYGDTFSRQGKKLTTKRFKETLLGIQDKNMKEQEKHLDDFIENWKDGIEQVDDILVIGVRL